MTGKTIMKNKVGPLRMSRPLTRTNLKVLMLLNLVAIATSGFLSIVA